ncbi:MAG: dihydroxyacetone kinase [Actinobacteria bacterium]|nr:MAG: dihydroxyacetone kinase [Actinomycetota bacterium]
MKKLINDPSAAVDEMVEAFAAAHADIVELAAPRVVARAETSNGKVGLAIGGGSGHEPAFLGYVGAGMADTAAIGNIFAAPGPEIVLDSIRRADHGKGVILIYGNYSGDVLNCRLAIQRAEGEGIDVRSVFVSDDVASAGADEVEKRRGIAGDIVVFKTTGAAAEAGLTLDEVERVARKANANTRSMGVALTGAELPGAARPIFESEPDEMDVGLGVHGEPGISREPIGSADEVGRLLADRILDDLGCPAGSRVAVLVNGLGATPPVEQYLVYRAVRETMIERGLTVERSYVGEYVTSLQMAGVSATVTLLDDELLSLLDAPARTVSLLR